MKYLFLIIFSVTNTSLAEETQGTLQIKQIDSGVYLHTSYKTLDGYGIIDSNGLVVTHGNQAFIVDTPWSENDTKELLSWVKRQGFQIKASISTHFHEDCTAGIELLNLKSIPTYTSELTNKLLTNNSKPTAKNIFSDSNFVLHEGLVEVFYPGPGHTKDNLVIWLPQTKTLFGGCLVRGLEWNGLGFIGDAFVRSWADSIRNIQSRYNQIRTIIPGHGKVGDVRILNHTIKLLEKASNENLTPTGS